MADLPMDLLQVKAVKEGRSGYGITFSDSRQAFLEKSHPEFEYYLVLARRSMERAEPIGIAIDKAGRIVEMEQGDSDIASQIIESTREELKIWFQGHDGTFRLRRSNPKFHRILATLETSIQRKSLIWFVARHPELLILDAQPADQGDNQRSREAV